MTSALVLVLSIAGFGLLIFGEQMGLGFDLVAPVVLLVPAVAAIALAISATTSRLSRFMVAEGRGAGAGLAAIFAVVLVNEVLEARDATTALTRLAWVLAGITAAFAIRSSDPWRNFVERDAAATRDLDPGAETRGAQAVAHFAACLGLLALIAASLPGLLRRLAALGPSWPVEPAWFVAGIALMALPGGILGIRRIAILVVAIAVFAVVLPGMVGTLGFAVDELGILRPTMLPALLRPVSEALPGHLALSGFQPDGFARGLLIGVALSQPLSAAGAWHRKTLALGAGLLFAGAFIMIGVAVESRLTAFVTERLAGTAPAQWPFFVFEEPLRGWVSACGASLVDPMTTAKGCGLASPRAILPAGALQANPAFFGPASAMALGWPTVLGHIWKILPALVSAAAFAFLVNAAASGFAEQFAFRVLRPGALRSRRLANARICLITLIGAAYLLARGPLPVDQDFLRFVLFAAMAVIIVAGVGFWLVRLTRWGRRIRVRRPRDAMVEA